MASCPPELVPTFPIGRVERIARLRSTIVPPGPGPKLPFLDPDAGAVRHARVDGRAQARPGFWRLPKQAVAWQNLNDEPACPRNRCPLRYWNTHPSARLVRFNFSAISTSRRSASEREGLSGCFSVHASTLSLSAEESRTGIVSPYLRPGGLPLFLCTLFSCFGTISCVQKMQAGDRQPPRRRP